MYQRLVATLDGSPASEAVLPYLSELVRVLDPEEVVLLSIIETGRERDTRPVETYLEGVANQLKNAWGRSLPSMPTARWSAMPVRPEDAAGKARGSEAAGGILEFARENQSDLIVMSTHGRTGFNRWLLGSVAEQVLQSAEVPVFLVRTSQESPERPFQLKRILAPLDGSPSGEQCLPYLEELARKARPEVTLLNVATPNANGHSDDDNEDMLTYLDHIAAGLRGSGAPIGTKMRSGRPSEETLDECQDSGVDLIVMTTHGRTGLGRLALGSVAYNVVSNSTTPVFLVRARNDVAIMEHLTSPLVYRCYHCGHRTYLDSFSPTDRCGRCHYHLKSCGNCAHFDGMACVLQLPYASETYPGNRCKMFEFRKVRLVA